MLLMKHQCIRYPKEHFIPSAMSFYLNESFKRKPFLISLINECVYFRCLSYLNVSLTFQCQVWNFVLCIWWAFGNTFPPSNVLDLITLALYGNSQVQPITTLVFDNLFGANWLLCVQAQCPNLDALTSVVWVEVRFKTEGCYYSHVKHR